MPLTHCIEVLDLRLLLLLSPSVLVQRSVGPSIVTTMACGGRELNVMAWFAGAVSIDGWRCYARSLTTI